MALDVVESRQRILRIHIIYIRVVAFHRAHQTFVAWAMRGYRQSHDHETIRQADTIVMISFFFDAEPSVVCRRSERT